MEKAQITQYFKELNGALISARVDGTDKDDVLFLIHKLGLKSAEDVFAILQKYYPREQIKPATQFFIEELFEA